MTCCKVALFILAVYRSHILTLFSRVRTSGVEATARGGICRGGNITAKHDSVHLNIGIRVRNCREECLCIRVTGIGEDIFLVTKLNHPKYSDSSEGTTPNREEP